MGSMVAGPADFIAKVHKYRKMLGGGMRQAGVLAAPGKPCWTTRSISSTQHLRSLAQQLMLSVLRAPSMKLLLLLLLLQADRGAAPAQA